MPALPEYKTRILLENRGVPLVPGVFLTELPKDPPVPSVYLKAQIPGATSRAAVCAMAKFLTPCTIASDVSNP